MPNEEGRRTTPSEEPPGPARTAGPTTDSPPRAEEPVADTPSRADEPAPSSGRPTREQLLAAHAEARRRRNAAPLGSEAWLAAVTEIARIEIAIAELDRTAQPPRL